MDKFYKNEKGQYHRTDGPAIIYSNGDMSWYKEDMLHRTDGPAIEWISGTISWWYMGIRHRIDGPAIEWVDGIKEWYIEGKQYTEQEFNDQKLKQQLIPPEMWEI